MTSYNNITGDALVSKSNTNKFRDNYDKIFSKPDKEKKDERKLKRVP